MKTPVLISTIAVLLFSCSKKSPEITTKVNTPTTEVIHKISVSDSIKVEDSAKITDVLTGEFHAKVLVFENISDKALQDSLYAPLNIKLDNYSKRELQKGLDAKKAAFYQEIKEMLSDWSPEFKQIWGQHSAMKVFSDKNDFLTVQYTADGYTGGAHGYYSEIYKAFDTKNLKTLQLKDILKAQDPQIWSRILMDNFLKNDLDTEQAQMLLVKDIPLNNNFYFDDQHLYFLYNQYEIAAYAAGPILIKVPFADIKPFLNDEFKSRLKIQ